MFRILLVLCLISAGIIQITILVLPAVPLGIPGEWTWDRHDFVFPSWEAVVQFIPAVFGAVLLGFVVYVGERRLFRFRLSSIGDAERQWRGPRETILLLILLAFASWCWMRTCERCTPAPYRSIRPLWVLYDPSSSGYFFEAVFGMASVEEFLRGYEERMQEGDVLHVGTHPPGLFLLSRGLVELVRRWPAVAAPARLVTLRDDIRAFRTLEADVALQRPLTDDELGALMILSVLTAGAAALTVIPLFAAVRCLFDPVVAWRTAALWATVPCVIVFWPKSDVLFTLTSMTVLSLMVLADLPHHGPVRKMVLAAVSGMVLWVGLLLSLAHLAVLALIAALTGIRMLRGLSGSQQRLQRLGKPLMPFLVMAGTVMLLTWAFSEHLGCSLPDVWRLNLQNHARFYEHFHRTVHLWRAVNLPELGLALGLPLALLAVIGMFRLHRADGVLPQQPCPAEVCVAVAATVAILWLSGRNSGEAARLWCFLTPWLLIPAACVLREEQIRDGQSEDAFVWKTAMTVQAAVCVLTVGLVSGFAFS